MNANALQTSVDVANQLDWRCENSSLDSVFRVGCIDVANQLDWRCERSLYLAPESLLIIRRRQPTGLALRAYSGYLLLFYRLDIDVANQLDWRCEPPPIIGSCRVGTVDVANQLDWRCEQRLILVIV